MKKDQSTSTYFQRLSKAKEDTPFDIKVTLNEERTFPLIDRYDVTIEYCGVSESTELSKAEYLRLRLKELIGSKGESLHEMERQMRLVTEFESACRMEEIRCLGNEMIRYLGQRRGDG